MLGSLMVRTVNNSLPASSANKTRFFEAVELALDEHVDVFVVDDDHKLLLLLYDGDEGETRGDDVAFVDVPSVSRLPLQSLISLS